MRPPLLVPLLGFAVLAFVRVGVQAEAKPADATPNAVPNPILILIRDAGVQAELRLDGEQKKTVGRLVTLVDEPLWLLRDQSGPESESKKHELFAKLEEGLRATLRPGQRDRLKQLVRRAQGLSALKLPGTVQELHLTADQQQQFRRTGEETRRALQELRARPNGKPLEMMEKAGQLQSEELEKLTAILTDRQKRQWVASLGKPFDLSAVRQRAVKAPELRGVSAWINTEPLTPAHLHGRVVIIHFWAFG